MKLVAVPDWQPISTAPKDGSTILATRAGADPFFNRHAKLVHWSGWGGGVWETSAGGKLWDDDVTHWQPIDPPPPWEPPPFPAPAAPSGITGETT